MQQGSKTKSKKNRNKKRKTVSEDSDTAGYAQPQHNKDANRGKKPSKKKGREKKLNALIKFCVIV